MSGRWRVGDRENGKPVEWVAEFGPLTLSLRWHVVDASDGREWWVLFMLPSPPFNGWVSGNDSDPDELAFSPDLTRRQLGAAQVAAEVFAAGLLEPYARALEELNK